MSNNSLYQHKIFTIVIYYWILCTLVSTDIKASLGMTENPESPWRS